MAEGTSRATVIGGGRFQRKSYVWANNMHALVESIVRDTTRSPRLQRVLSPSCRVFSGRTAGRRRLFRGIHPNSENAMNSAPQNQQISYNNTASAGHVAHVRHFVFPYDYPVVFWLKQLLKPGAVIFNLDDNIGISYYAWRGYLRVRPET